MAHQMAIENPHVKSDVVEATEFPQLVQKYRVVGVPKVVINEKVEFQGALPPDAYLQQVMSAVTP